MRRLVLIGMLLTLHGGFVRAGDLSGRAILSFQQFEADTFTTDGFRQTYDARWERRLEGPFRLRLSLRVEEDDGGRDAGFGRASRSFSQLQPGAELRYTLPRLDLQATFDHLRSSSVAESGTTGERTLDRAIGRLSWRPEGLPGIMLLAESRDLDDPSRNLARTDRLAQATADYTWKDLTATATVRHATLDDGQESFARETADRQGLLAYDGSYWSGRLTASGNVLLTRTSLDERATAGATSAARPVPIVRLLASVDDSPADDRDVSPRPEPALADGNVDRPAGVSVGPGSTSHQNLALDFGRVADVDGARIHVRDEGGQLVPFGGTVRWDVWVSQDGVRWNPLPAQALTSFTTALSYYEVRFDRVTTRFLKVTSFGTNATDTRLTEVQAFEHVDLAAGEMRHTDIDLANAVIAISAQPTRRTRLAYNGLFNDLRQTADDRAPLDSRGLDQTVSAEVDPLKVLGLVARYQRRYLTQTAGYRQDFDAWSGIVRIRPLEGLEQSFEYTRSTEDNAGLQSTSTLLAGHLFARFYDGVDTSLDFGRQEQVFAISGADVERLFVTGAASVQLTRSLRVLVTGSVQDSTYGLDVPVDPNIGLPPRRDQRFAGDFYYRPSTQLALGVRLGWADTGRVSGFLQRYHLDWFPFPGGTLRLGGQYDEDVDALANRRSRRLMLTPAWTINRRLILNTTYTVITIPEEPSLGTRAFVVTVTASF